MIRTCFAAALPLLFAALIGAPLHTQASTLPDSLMWNWVSLDSAAIATFSPLLAPEQIAATRWTADSLLGNGYGSADVSNALNALPGVQMDTRGMGGSRRLNVRGSAIRSPFGVRNTMLYVRGFLLTEADGTSPLEWLEPAWSGGMELVSGAAATTFGGAYGGALLVHGTATPQVARIQSVLGSTGNGGIQARLNATASLQGWNVRMSRTSNSGYRDQEWNRRWHVEVDRAYGTKKAKHYDWLAFQTGAWGLPGSLDSTAAPTEAPGLAYDAQVQRRRALWGHHLHVPNLSANQHRSSLDVWTLLRWTDKVNPYGTSEFYNGYKEESGTGASLRVRQRFAKWAFANMDFQAEWTLLAVHDRGSYGEWNNALEGVNGTLNYDLELRQSRAHWAPALSWAWKNGARLETSVAMSQRTRMAQGTASDTAYSAPFNATQLLPRVGWSQPLGEDVTAFVQVSSGFSDPTNFESLSTDGNGTLVANLNAERAWTFEGGARHTAGELVLYHQRIQGALVQTVTENGAVTFVNADSAVVLSGVEWASGQTWGRHRFDWSGAAQFHRWSEGNLPGSAKWLTSVQHRWRLWDRSHDFAIATWLRAVGPTPLNNEGTDIHPSYATINMNLDWTPPSKRVVVSAGVRNLTNTSYSGWNQLNAFGGRYYNPAPPRTVYVSAVWDLH